MPPIDADILDEEDLLSRVEGDRGLLSEIVGEFVRDCPRLLAQVREAAAAGDTDALSRAAHALRGPALLFAAGPAAEAALELERMGRTGDLAHAEEAVARLEAELERLTAALSALTGVQMP